MNFRCDKCGKFATKIAYDTIEITGVGSLISWEHSGGKRYGCKDHDVQPEIVCETTEAFIALIQGHWAVGGPIPEPPKEWK